MPPTSPCNSTEPSSALADATALAAQRDFYEALAQGDGQRLQKIFVPSEKSLRKSMKIHGKSSGIRAFQGKTCLKKCLKRCLKDDKMMIK